MKAECTVVWNPEAKQLKAQYCETTQPGNTVTLAGDTVTLPGEVTVIKLKLSPFEGVTAMQYYQYLPYIT